LLINEVKLQIIKYQIKNKSNMNKKIIRVIAVIAIALTASWNIKQSKSEPNKMSNLAMANVEALAGGEDEMCPNGCMENGSGCLCHYWFPTYKEA